ncbi:MAG: hypothetical protein GX149_02570 [Acholeplasmataceae bacterium]|jgi:hypothetical protein|nr:hypothetical protein [Acholeplasmataceae bacterium]
MTKIDVYERKKLAKRRIKPTVITIFLVIAVIVAAALLLVYKDKFNLTTQDKKTFVYSLSIIVFVFTLLLFYLILRLTRPWAILESDLNNIYICKTAEKEIVVPMVELKSIKTKIKSGKKAKKVFGTLILRTPTKRYKVKKVIAVDEVEKEIFVLLDKLQFYLEGKRQGMIEQEQLQANRYKKQ